ncbi:gly-3, partial [Symbiodinium sp. KB8]
EDAKTAANFSQFHHDLATKVPLGGNKMYDYHCYMRYLAMAEAGGGWMSDYDVIPTWFPPDTDLPNDGRFTSYQNHVPALLSGRQDEWYRMADTLLTLAVSKGKEKAIKTGSEYLFSDMWPGGGGLQYFEELEQASARGTGLNDGKGKQGKAKGKTTGKSFFDDLVE